MPPTAHAAHLADLFSKARLSLHIPSSSSSSTSSRSTVFFDEVLNVEAVLTLPSDPLLPIASTSSHAEQPIHSLPLLSSRSSLGQKDIPPHLIALLACLHVNLSTDYVPESVGAGKSTNPYEPLSTVKRGFEQLQLLPSHNSQSEHAAVRAFSNSWAGNQAPKPHRTLKDTDSSKTSHHAHVTHDAHHWEIRWHLRVPLNFISTPFSPLLSITAALTLRLDPTLLETYLPTSPSSKFVRGGFGLSLLGPLHEGPVYPDESLVQSQARATASAALGLDGPNGLGSYLAHLGKEVVGGNSAVVTPRAGKAALEGVMKRRSQAFTGDTIQYKSMSKPDSNGDLANSNFSSTASKEIEHAAGLQIFKRSTREIVPLKTGLNVRMRTLVTSHSPNPTTTTGLESSHLVLSVELENPFESSSTFIVSNISIDIDQGKYNSHDVVAQPLHPLPSILPISLGRGSQHNLLYYVSSAHNSGGTVEEGGRNVTITISGRPKEGEVGEVGDFDSQWNCALDLTKVLADAGKKGFIGGSRGANKEGGKMVGGAGAVAGNPQYAASSLRAAQVGDSVGWVGEVRTPKPGQLGKGFPTRLASAEHHRDGMVGESGSEFLAKAKARAANRLSHTPLAPTEGLGESVKPWISTSSHSAATGEGLVVLSTLRTRTTRTSGQSDVLYESKLGPDGVARPSISTGSKTLHPTSISSSTDLVQTGGNLILDLCFLSKFSSIGDIKLSWTTPPNTLEEPRRTTRDSLDSSQLQVKGRLMDAETARLKSSLMSAQGDALNGLIPIEDDVRVEGGLQAGQTRKIGLGLRCLSPGYHALPPLRLRFETAAGGEEVVMLEDLGSVFVTPAAVL